MNAQTLKQYLPKWLDRIQPSGTAVLLGTAVVVGVGTGLGAVFFIRLIDLVQRIFFEGGESVFGSLGRGLFIVVPVVGGLISGPIIAFFAKEAKGHGVPEVMQAIALQGGRIRPRVVVAKIAASAVCIGSGGSAGREGPIVQVGSALGSTLGQWLNLSEARIRNLVACGAAAGIAATFNAPIAGVIFAMEIILGELHLGDLGNVVVSAVSASAMAHIFLGERPAFAIPRYAIKTPWEILLYVLLGILSALVAVFFIRMLYWFEDLFDNWHFPDALKPAVGGVLLGGLAFFYPVVLGMGFVPVDEARLGLPLSANLPHIFSAGFPIIEGALLGQLSFVLLFLLIFLKPLATSFTLGSGNSGGVFAPALFSGAALGGAFGRVVESIAPGVTAGPGAFATVGMAAVFAGAARAPFTAILIVFEMTNDYGLILPLMAAVSFAMLIAERMHRESIYTLKLTRRGIRLQSGRDVDVMQAVRVEEVMVRQPEAMPVDLPVTLLASEFIRTGRHGFPVLNTDGSLYGVVSLSDYRQSVAGGGGDPEELTVRDIATRGPITAFPDETVDSVLRRMAPRDLSRVPVVDRANPGRLVGMIRRNDIVRAHEIGAMRREEARRRAETFQPVSENGAKFVDVLLVPGSQSVGRTVANLDLPREAVLVSIRRGQDLVIPHGDTKLEPGDVVTALCEGECALDVERLLNKAKDEKIGPV
jgi:CIC family chloride channel protein